MFSKEGPHNTFSVLPTRSFRFIVDWDVSESLLNGRYGGILSLILDLREAPVPIDVRLILPTYLTNGRPPLNLNRFGDVFIEIKEKAGIGQAKISSDLNQKERDLISRSSLSLDMLALADAVQADTIITDIPDLVEMRWALRHHMLVRITPGIEFGDIVEICAHGHGLFWSAKKPERDITVDTYYAMYHEEGSKRTQWVLKYLSEKISEELNNEIRSSMLNRYPFLLYARDQVRFYELQLDHYSRRGLQRRFIFPVSYHITQFYLLLWGMLEQLTLIAKHKLKLTIEDRRCGILSKDFWKEVRKVDPGLKGLIEHKDVSSWIGHMADMRHLAAHQTIPMPTQIFEHTEESKKDDGYIRAKLRIEKPFMYTSMPKEYMDILEPQMIQHWRIRHMKEVISKHVMISRPGKGTYFRDPMNSVDADLGMLMKIVDAFLNRLCGYPL